MTMRGLRRTLASGLLAATTVLVVAAPAFSDPGQGNLEEPAPASETVDAPVAEPVSVAVIVPITAPATTTGLLSSAELERLTGPFGLLTRRLDAVAGTPATLAIDPLILASIRVLGNAAPPLAQLWLDRLESLPNASFLLPYGDADLVAAARSGTLGDLAPLGFGFTMSEDNFSASDTPTPEEPSSATPSDLPSSTPDGDDEETEDVSLLPATDQLLAWDATLPAVAWPLDGLLGASDLVTLQAAGYTDVVVSSSATGTSETALVDLGGTTGIVPDGPLSELLDAASEFLNETDRALALDAFSEGLAERNVTASGQNIVLTLGRGSSPASNGLAAALERIQGAESTRFVSLEEILDGEARPAQLGEGPDPSERDSTLATLAEDADAELTFSSVLVDPAALLEPRRLARIALTSNAWADDAEGWSEAVAAFRSRSTVITTSITIEHGSDVLQLARSTNFRVSVSNALNLPVTVRVSIDPRSPILQGDDAVELTIEPQATGTAYFAVEALTNGELVVDTAVHSPSGVPLDAGSVRVTVQAEWEGLGTLLVMLLLLAVFGIGIVRIALRRIRARREAASEPDGETDD